MGMVMANARTKFDRLPIARPEPNDIKEMREAIERLAPFEPRRPTAHQLKVTPTISYYPGKGTIFRDGTSAALPARGIDALVDLLRKDGYEIEEADERGFNINLQEIDD